MSVISSVALYARASSQRQAEELTILSQVAALRERIQQDGPTELQLGSETSAAKQANLSFAPAVDQLRRALGS